MKQKSNQVPLGLLFKNENKNEEMLDILQDLHEKYVPVANTMDSSEKVVLEKIFFGGDQLTDERSRNARDARRDGDNEYERLEGVIPKVEEWHAIRILYQIRFDIHFKQSSVNDVGTMCSNMNVINNVNAKTSNVMDNFNTCKEYVNIETDALITAAALKYFNMESLETGEEEVIRIPPQVLNGTKQNKRVWLHKHVKKLLEVHVMDRMSMEHEDVRAAVHVESRPRQRQVKLCSVCGKPYVYEKALQNHIKKDHPGHVGTQTHISSDKDSQEKASKKLVTDDRYNYSYIRLRMGLLLRNFDDSVKECDGNRILRCWKIALLIFRAYGHTKYALCALQLIAATEALLTPHQACSLTWNRTVNNKGGPGKNISLDLRLEHINNLTKGMLKNLGPNISESSATRCSKSVNMIERLLESIDSDLKVYRPSGNHNSKKSKHDFKLLVEELHNKGNVFEFKPSPERAYLHFPQFQRSLLRSIDYRLLNKWITDHKKEMARNE